MNLGFINWGEFLEKVIDSKLLIEGRFAAPRLISLMLTKTATLSVSYKWSPLSLFLSFCLSAWKVTNMLAYILHTVYSSTPSAADGTSIS